MNNIKSAIFSSKTENWKTPKDAFRTWNEEFHFATDPCTYKENHLGLRVFLTKEEDGLHHRELWQGNVFINPPYPVQEDVIAEAKRYAEEGRGTVVLLLPARTDTRWYHRFICSCKGEGDCFGNQCTGEQPNVEKRLIRGRLKFEGVSDKYKRNSAPFPSVLVIFRKAPLPRELSIMRVEG